MNCPNCHKEIPDDAKFCPLCGTQVQGNEPGTEPQQQSPAPNNTPVATIKKRPVKQIAAGVIFVLCFLLFSPFRSIVGAISMLAVPVLGVLLILALLFKKPKKKLGIGFLAAIILSMIFIYSFPTCDHEWIDATCTQPQTCSKCGKTEGEALGHIPGDWEEGTPDPVSATVEYYQVCQVCGEKLDIKTENLTALYQDNTFLFSPKQFTERMNNMLQDIDGYTSAEVLSLDNGAMGTVIKEGSRTATIIYIGKHDVMGIGDESIENEIRSLACIFKTSDVNKQVIAITASIQTCDPNIDVTDASDMAQQLAIYDRGTPITKNGIEYIYDASDSVTQFWIYIDKA